MWVNLVMLCVTVVLMVRAARRAGTTGQLRAVWFALLLLVGACYYLVRFIVSMAG